MSDPVAAWAALFGLPLTAERVAAVRAELEAMLAVLAPLDDVRIGETQTAHRFDPEWT
jgi:Protein of unknown function (DUF4089)